MRSAAVALAVLLAVAVTGCADNRTASEVFEDCMSSAATANGGTVPAEDAEATRQMCTVVAYSD